MKTLIENLIEREVRKQTKIREILKETQILSETNLNRVMTKYFDIGFIIITADRTCKAEKDRECSEEEDREQEEKNKQNEPRLKRDLVEAGFGYLPAWGGFKERSVDQETGEVIFVDNPNPEKSFIVPMQKAGSNTPLEGDGTEIKELGMKLSAKYNQDDFFFKPPNNLDKSAYFIYPSGETEMTFNNFTINDLAQEYYTDLRKKGPSKTRPKKNPSYGRFSALPENKQFVLFIPKPPSHVQEARKRYGEKFYNLKK